jgi:hypothetical protein
MGSSVSKGFEEMQANQKRTMLENQERMQRTMIARQMAMARDRVDWMLGAWGAAALAGSIATWRGVKVPPAAGLLIVVVAVSNFFRTCLLFCADWSRRAAVPFLVYSTVLAYQWDFA